MTDIRAPSIPDLTPAPTKYANMLMRAAETAVGEIAAEIAAFQDTLREDEEAWMSVMGAGGGLEIRPAELRPLGSDKLVIEGEDREGRRIRAVQHVTQVSLVMIAVKAERPQRIGFHFGEDE